jgi:hypothetical protein
MGSLRLLMDDALRVSDVPFQLVQGARTIEEQQRLFDGPPKRSNVNPRDYPAREKLYAAAKHVTGPGMPLSRAVDIIIDVKGKEYDKAHMCYVAGVVMAIAALRGIPVRWGGNWSRDEVILYDQKLIDMPHFELL